MKKALLFTMLVGLLNFNLSAQAPAEASAARTQDTVQEHSAAPEIDATLRRAAEIHESILISLAEHEYDAVFPAFQQILALDLQGEQEGTLVDAAWVIVGDLRENSQFATAHRIIDATLQKVSATSSRWRLLMLKAQTYRDAGDLAGTRRMLIEARKLEN